MIDEAYANARCDRCAYWQRHPDEFGDPPLSGECRRRSPHHEVGSFLRRGEWPRTAANEWCGDGRPSQGNHQEWDRSHGR